MRPAFGFNKMVNPRGCPGSYAKVERNESGKGTCPFCLNDYRVNDAGFIRGHVRP